MSIYYTSKKLLHVQSHVASIGYMLPLFDFLYSHVYQLMGWKTKRFYFGLYKHPSTALKIHLHQLKIRFNRQDARHSFETKRGSAITTTCSFSAMTLTGCSMGWDRIESTSTANSDGLPIFYERLWSGSTWSRRR